MFVNEVRISPLLKLPVFWVLPLLPLDRREQQQNSADTSLTSSAALGQLPAPLAAAAQPSDIQLCCERAVGPEPGVREHLWQVQPSRNRNQLHTQSCSARAEALRFSAWSEQCFSLAAFP